MKIKYFTASTSFFLALTLFSQPALSHSGRTDSSGCHTNRKTGEYHCHNKKPKFKTQRQEPKTSTKSQKQQKKITNKVISKNSSPNSGNYMKGPYKWEDDNGLNIVFDIKKVPDQFRDRFLKE